MDDAIMQMGAIISKSIALSKNPILRAVRSDAVNEYDSGWQFTEGNLESASDASPEIWRLSEVLDIEPSLLKYMGLPSGTIIARASVNDPWTVS